MISTAGRSTPLTCTRLSTQGLEEWQQPLAKIVVDQTALSLAWNSLYFGLLGAMRLDPPGNVLGQLWSSGFSLMKAGWRLWPLAHVVTYAMVPPEHRCKSSRSAVLILLSVYTAQGKMPSCTHVHLQHIVNVGRW